MALPSALLHSVATPPGKLALVIGAGCSVEAPTSLPVAAGCSWEIHRRLIADGVLSNGDCADPSDLCCLADAVYAKTNSQGALVERFRDAFELKHARPNSGYLLAAALLSESVIASIVTLNFDQALTNAVTEVGAGAVVGVIEAPADLSRQKQPNVYYLHRNVNASDPEAWILRSGAIAEEWKGHWEPIIATKVLLAPVVVFAGLGAVVDVLVESTKLIKQALPDSRALYQVDPADKDTSESFKSLGIAAEAYIRLGWCAFMEQLADRVVIEQLSQLDGAVTNLTTSNALQAENLSDLLKRLGQMGLLVLGKIRAEWLLHEKPYCPDEVVRRALIADLLLGIGLIARLSGTSAIPTEDGLVEFHRDGRAATVILPISGCGHRNRAAIEAALGAHQKRYANRPVPPRTVLVAGTSDSWKVVITPPENVLRGNYCGDDVVTGPMGLRMLHLDELRTSPATTILEVVR